MIITIAYTINYRRGIIDLNNDMYIVHIIVMTNKVITTINITLF